MLVAKSAHPKLVRNRLERGYVKANRSLQSTRYNAERIAKAQAIVAKAPTIPPKAESEG